MRFEKSIILSALVLIGLNGCWLVAAGAGGEAGYVAAQDDRTTSQTLTDQRITASVKSLLLADSEVSGLAINVDTFKSDVTLKGVVDTEHEREKAISIAMTVSGVNSVKNKLVIVK